MTYTPNDRARASAARERYLKQQLGLPEDEQTILAWLEELRAAHRSLDALGALLSCADVPLESEDLRMRQRAAQARVERLERNLGIKVKP